MQVSLLTDHQLFQVTEEYEMLKKGSSLEGSLLAEIAGSSASTMTIAALSCYRELYLRSVKTEKTYELE